MIIKPPKEYLTTAEVATLLGVSTHKLIKDRYLGRGMPHARIGKSVRYKRADVDAYVEENSSTPFDL